MAIAVIAGLISSTLLTLIVIPCVYYVFETGKEKVFGKEKSRCRNHDTGQKMIIFTNVKITRHERN